MRIRESGHQKNSDFVSQVDYNRNHVFNAYCNTTATLMLTWRGRGLYNTINYIFVRIKADA